MNVGEGFRRVGIVLGVVGSAIGILSGYESAQTLWNAHITHQRFESLMASPLMLRVAKDVKDPARYVSGGLLFLKNFKTEDRKEADQGTALQNLATDPDFLKLSGDEQKYILGRAKNKGVTSPSTAGTALGDERDVMDVFVNLNGFKEVLVDKSGQIFSIVLSTGESIPKTEPPTLMAFMALLLYPLGGFLVPWGAIRVIAWLVAGFLSK